MMVGRRSSRFGMVYFQGRAVKLPGGMNTQIAGELKWWICHNPGSPSPWPPFILGRDLLSSKRSFTIFKMVIDFQGITVQSVQKKHQRKEI